MYEMPRCTVTKRSTQAMAWIGAMVEAVRSGREVFSIKTHQPITL